MAIAHAIYMAVQANSNEVERSRIINPLEQVVYNNIIDFKNRKIETHGKIKTQV